MRVDVSGTRDGQPWPPRGSVIDLPDDEARQYCESGMAEPVAVFGSEAAETATPPKHEERRERPKARSAGLTKDDVPTP
jgi:hypothetical protein